MPFVDYSLCTIVCWSGGLSQGKFVFHAAVAILNSTMIWPVFLSHDFSSQCLK